MNPPHALQPHPPPYWPKKSLGRRPPLGEHRILLILFILFRLYSPLTLKTLGGDGVLTTLGLVNLLRAEDVGPLELLFY
jgi:hypothetical protein